MATSPLFIAQMRGDQTIFVPGFDTRPRVIYTPGANGSKITAINLASTDAAGSIDVQIGIAQKKTLSGSMGTGTFVDGGGGDDTITRTSASFLTDGWRQGDRMMVGEATTLANDFDALLTAVAATTLTFATATVAAGEVFGANTFLARLARSWRTAVVAQSGITLAAVSGMEPADAPFIDGSPSRVIELGPNDLLVAQLDAALLTGETLDATVIGGDY